MELNFVILIVNKLYNTKRQTQRQVRTQSGLVCLSDILAAEEYSSDRFLFWSGG